MSDILVNAAVAIPNFRWDNGEQPDATKFRNLFGAFKSSVELISRLIGPVIGPATVVNPNVNTISSHSYFSKMDSEERSDFLDNAGKSILSTFNLARTLGSVNGLNPVYLPGTNHTKESLGDGFLLDSTKKIQQLPFPPQESYTASMSALGWTLAESRDEVLNSPGDPFFYIGPEGTLYLNRLPSNGTKIKYDLTIPNTYGPLGSGYTCIPDLSILSMSDEAITSLTEDEDDFGRCKVSWENSDLTYIKWKISLPQIVSVKDPLQKTNDLAATDSEPAGEYIGSKRYYTLTGQLYTGAIGSVIDSNLLGLFYEETGETYFFDWEKGEDATTLYAYGPNSLGAIFRDNNSIPITGTALFNTKHFYLVTLSSNIIDNLNQNTLNFARHRHTGADSYRISHRDLLDAEGEKQVIGNENGSGGGLNVLDYARQISYSENKDNVHAQYLHRLGYFYGGTSGIYESVLNFNKLIDFNMMHGDLVLGPIEKTDGIIPRKYTYADQEEFDAANKNIVIDWDLDELPSAAITNNGARRSHSLIFGFPYIGNEAFGGGGTKLYYESSVIDSDTVLDNKGELYTIARHGFIPGNETGPHINDSTLQTQFRGLNIAWGNLFFGYREDIFKGRLTGSGNNDATESSAHFRTSEFNVVATGNGKAGSNTNSAVKKGTATRDGIALKAVKGANIWLSASNSDTVPLEVAESEDDYTDYMYSTYCLGEDDIYRPSKVLLEASRCLVPGDHGTAESGLHTLSYPTYKGYETSGAGVALSPGLAWSEEGSTYSPFNTIGDEYAFANLWDSQNFGDLPLRGSGGILDLFAFAPEYQNNVFNENLDTNQTSLLDFPIGKAFLRARYGINIAVDNIPSNLLNGFTFGNKSGLSEWGESVVDLKTSTPNQSFIHREVKFFGNTSETTGNQITGANLNLNYKMGSSYGRFNKSISWTSDSEQGEDSPWANSRRLQLGSTDLKVYGSNIRQAASIEAFSGFRSDPLQPYVVEYVLPFSASFQTPFERDEIVTHQISDWLENRTFLFMPKGSDYNDDYESLQDTRDSDRVSIVKTYIDTSNIHKTIPNIDALIKTLEEDFLRNSGKNTEHSSNRFPQCLVDFKMNLQYFAGKKRTNNSISIVDGHFWNSNTDFHHLKNGDTVMTNPGDGTSAGQISQVVMLSSPGNWGYSLPNTRVIGYNSYLATTQIGLSATPLNHKNRYPNYTSRYPFAMGDSTTKAFTPGLVIDHFTIDSNTGNVNLPFRLHLVNGDPFPGEAWDPVDLDDIKNNDLVAIQFLGTFTVKAMSIANVKYADKNTYNNVP
jgi:hypothetical protein